MSVCESVCVFSVVCVLFNIFNFQNTSTCASVNTHSASIYNAIDDTPGSFQVKSTQLLTLLCNIL